MKEETQRTLELAFQWRAMFK